MPIIHYYPYFVFLDFQSLYSGLYFMINLTYYSEYCLVNLIIFNKLISFHFRVFDRKISI